MTRRVFHNMSFVHPQEGREPVFGSVARAAEYVEASKGLPDILA